MPGQEIFSYEDEDGTAHDIGSHDVNEYLRSIVGDNFTAKDFRTWAGTVLAVIALQEFELVSHQTKAKKNVVKAIEGVAKMLGNTPSVCRKCYVHPEILNSYLAGDTTATIRQRVVGRSMRTHSEFKTSEAGVMSFLMKRMTKSKKLRN